MKSLRLVLRYFRLNLSAAMEYRANFLVQVFGMALNNATFVFFWWIIFERVNGQVGGYGFEDVMFIWAVCASAFGLSSIFFANMHEISRLIVSGELDVFLLQPKSVLLNILCAKTSLSSWGDFVYGIVLIALTQNGSASAWAFFALGTALGACLMVGIAVMAHTLTFYFGDASFIGGMAVEFVINFSIYPKGIYPFVVRALMYTLIPAAFIVHVPLQLARGFHPGLLLGMVAAVVAYCAFAAWFFYRGLRRYESGNLIATRM